MEEFKRRATVHDVARAAGVSLATVDRELNGRPGVRPQTAEKVAEAIRLLDFRRDLSASLLARARDLTLCFVLPKGGNAFMEALASAITRQARHLRGERLSLRTIDVPPFDAAALSAALARLTPEECDRAVIVATESRTSSPVRIPRDPGTLRHPQIGNLFPCGEGAGYAGGIVSAAMDGERVADRVVGV